MNRNRKRGEGGGTDPNITTNHKINPYKQVQK